VGLPYASVVSEMAEDSSPIYGIEIHVPCVGAIVPYGSFFLSPDALSGAGYQQAALQAIAFLQTLYGFVVVDYSFHGALLYRKIASAAVSVAARAAGMVDRLSKEREEFAVQSDCLVKEVSLLGQTVYLLCS
jgi:hypothetical protein